MDSPSSDQQGSQRLPAYRALLSVDVRDFSGYRGSDHNVLTRKISTIMASAFRRCELSSVWENEIWRRLVGDSYVAAFPSETVPLLLHPFLGALQDQLVEVNRLDPIGDPPRPVRMRVGVHVGPVTEPCQGAPEADGSGRARVELHRLLDAAPLKALLDKSDDVTCVAAIVSERVFDDAVRTGYVGEPPGLYRPVNVEVKSYRGRAYLRVPYSSGDLLDSGFGVATDDEPTSEPTRASPNPSTDSLHGHRVTGVGSVGGDVGTVVSGTQGNVHVGDDVNEPRRRPPGRRRDG